MTISDFAIIDYFNTKNAVEIRFTNPQKSATTNTWECWIYDLATQTWSPDVTPKLTSVPFVFPYSGNTFLIRFRENRDCFWDDWQYGPFVAVVGPGTYTWNAVAETLNGVALVSLPLSNNMCKITGIITGGIDGSSIALQTTTDVPGYVNAGKYFVGSTITVDATVPNWMNGLTISADLKMLPDYITDTGYRWKWQATNIVLLQGYPDWAYVFSGYVRSTFEGYSWNGTAGYKTKINFSIAGDPRLSSFAVALVFIDPEYPGSFNYRYTGPITAYWTGHSPSVGVEGPNDVWPYWVGIQLWAHPDPNKVFQRYDWAEMEGWKLVASG